MAEKKSNAEIALAVLGNWKKDFPDVKVSALAMAELLRRFSTALSNK